MDKETFDLAQQRKGRMIFIAMAIFFAVPLLVVVLMLRFNWIPAGKSLGELIVPPRMMSVNSVLSASDGKSADRFWTDKWNMVYLADECQKACMDRLHDLRQIQVSLYKDMPRVQRVLLTTTADVVNVKSTYPDMLIINQPGEVINNVAQQFNIGEENALQSGRLYLIDPLGYIMMSYPQSTKAADIRKDMVRLLKSSWAG
jgi:cytochrome oxidase Cu insertion factor (SCO1/SenC/PrrC family)